MHNDRKYQFVRLLIENRWNYRLGYRLGLAECRRFRGGADRSRGGANCLRGDAGADSVELFDHLYISRDEIVRMNDSVYIILYGDNFSRIPLYTYISFNGPMEYMYIEYSRGNV